MKQIINGKMYNTETAKKIGQFWNGYSQSDFKYLKETLYLTKKGAYFIHGDGGALTAYSETYGNSSCGAERLIAISEDEAKGWAMENLEPNEYTSIFGEVEEA